MLTVVILSVVHLWAGTALLNTQLFLHDFWFVTDVMWRAHLGDTPHLDVSTPVGQAFFWPYALATELVVPGVGAMLLGSVIVGLVGALVSWLLLRGRIAPPIWVLCGVFAFACAVGPRMWGPLVPVEFNHLAPYNRWGWALLAPLALYAFAPTGRTATLAPALFGAVAAVLILLKISFGLVAIGFLGLAVLTGNRRLRDGWIALGALAATLALTGLVEQNLLAYLADLQQALNAGDIGLRENIRLRKAIALGGAAFGCAAALILLAGALAGPASPGIVRRVGTLWRPHLYAAAVIVAGFLISIQNYPKTETPFFFVAILIGAGWAWANWQGHRPNRIARMAVLAILTSGALATTGRDIAGIVAHRIMALAGDAHTVTALGETPLAGLRLPRAMLDAGTAPPSSDPVICRRRYGWSEAQLRRALDIQALLAEAEPQSVILPLDGFNPYPALTGTPAPQRVLLWQHPGRTISTNTHPPPEQIFASVDTVVQSTECRHDVSDFLWTLYGTHIEAHFQRGPESDLSQIWIRQR